MKQIPSLYIATLSSLLLLQAGSAHAEDWGDWSLETEQIIESHELEEAPAETAVEPITASTPDDSDTQWGDWEAPSPTENPEDFEDSPLSAREQAIFNELDNSNLSDYETPGTAQSWEDEQPLLMQLEKLEQLHEAEELMGELIESEEARVTGPNIIIFDTAEDSNEEIAEEYGSDREMDADGSEILYDEESLPSNGATIDEYESNEALLETLPLNEIDALPINGSDMTDSMDEVLSEAIEFEAPENAVDALELIESMEELPLNEDILDEISDEMPLDEMVDELPFDGEMSDRLPLEDDLPFDDMDNGFDDDLADEVYQ